MYDHKYSKLVLPKDDWLIQRDKLADLTIKTLVIDINDIVLDVGCDNGFVQQKVATAARKVIGIDINPDALREHYGGEAMVMDATKLVFPSSSFDKIYSLHTIEHIKDLQSVFREVDRVLKPGGLAFFVYPWELFRGMAHARGAWKIYRNPFLGYRFHVHRLTPKKVLRFASGTNLRHIKSSLVFMRTPHWTPFCEK